MSDQERARTFIMRLKGSLGREARQVRKRKKVTQAEVSMEVGVSQCGISRIEHGMGSDLGAVHVLFALGVSQAEVAEMISSAALTSADHGLQN